MSVLFFQEITYLLVSQVVEGVVKMILLLLSCSWYVCIVILENVHLLESIFRQLLQAAALLEPRRFRLLCSLEISCSYIADS